MARSQLTPLGALVRGLIGRRIVEGVFQRQLLYGLGAASTDRLLAGH
jgi:hypothetical protein